jgi:hypothetical protein
MYRIKLLATTLTLTVFLFSVAYPQTDNSKNLPSKLQERYYSQHFSLSAGAWIPLSDLAVIGTHPSVGLQWGLRHKIHEFNVTLDFRFLKTKQAYEVVREGAVYVLNDYLGGYIGVEYILWLSASNFVDFGILAGVGYDGFSLSRQQVPSEPYEIGSINFNTGIRLNIYTQGETYFGIQPKYNFINYKNDGGTSFSGNAVSLQLFVGGFWGL